MQSITAVDILAGLKAAEAGQRAQKSVLGNRNPVCVAAAEAGPPLTPLSQIHQQQTLVEPSPLLKHNRTSQLLVGLAQNGETNATALEAADAAAAQSPARVAPPRSAAPPAAAQPPAPRQNPIITNAMSAVEEHGPWLREIPSVPVYTPSAEEWQDPLMYIRSIQPEAGKFGACVVKSPITPAVPAALLLKDLKFTTRLQKVKDDPWGKTWANGIKFWDSGRKCTVLEYAKFADDFARRKLGLAAELPTATVESMYWREKDLKVTRSGKECTVEYGNDIEGSAFHPKDPLGQSNWNLNSFSDLPGSALRYCISPAPGVTTPMLYIGMLYAAFAWHVEDHFMYSINYSHAGASKVWYCVPASAADDLEDTAAETVYLDPCTTMKEEQGASAQACNEAVAEALAGKTTAMSPRYLVDKGIPVYRAVQEAGSYVITFPRSYHSGFSTGFNLGEAVNFVLSDWWPFGEHARRLYKSFNRQQIISHEQLLCDDATALAAKLDTVDKIELDTEDRPVAIAFVAMMQQAHQLRERFQTKKIVQVASYSPGTASDAAEMRDSVPCSWCSHQSHLVFAVVDARKPQSQWEHVCLECAARAVDGDGDVLVRSGDDICAPSPHLMVYVKPLWSTMEDIAHRFTFLLRPGPVLGKNDASSTGGVGAAVQMHQSLSLKGCSENAIQNTETLCQYTWTELDEPLLYTPSWVAHQPGPTIVVGDANADEPHEVSQLEEKRSFRKRSRDDYAPCDVGLLEENKQTASLSICPTATNTATANLPASAPAAMKKKGGSFTFRASESSSPIYDATFFREDALVLPGKKTPVPRKVFKIDCSGELVICGSDIVKAISPYQAKHGAMSRCLGRKFYSATHGDVSAPDAYIVFIKGYKNYRGPAIGKSGAKVLLNSEKMKQDDDYGVLCAALSGVWDDLSGDSEEEQEEDMVEEEKGVEVVVAPAPAPIVMKPTRLKTTLGSASKSGEKTRNAVSARKRQKVVEVIDSDPSEEAEGGMANPVKVFLQNAEPLFLSLPQGDTATVPESTPFIKPQKQHQYKEQQQTPDHDTTPSASFMQHAANIILAETHKGTSGDIANNGPDDLPLGEAPGSSSHLRQYYLPCSSSPTTATATSYKADTSSFPSSDEEQVVVVAAYHIILRVLEVSNISVATMLGRWMKGVVAAPGVTKSHILCLAPLLYRCKNWKRSSDGIASTFVLTVEQCAVFYLFGLESVQSKATAAGRKHRIYSIMVSVWGEEAVLDVIAKVTSAEFVSSTPLGPKLKLKLSENIEAADDGDCDDGKKEEEGEDDDVVVVEDEVAVNKPTDVIDINPAAAAAPDELPLLEEAQKEKRDDNEKDNDDAVPDEEVEVVPGAAENIIKHKTEKMFIPFPPLFNAANSSLFISSPPLSSAVNMDHSVAADPEQVDVEIEAEDTKNHDGG
ncbi:hypothetical protein Ndes2526B_g04502 [Nannochloris sp. 'desiccata']|nr:putative Lysine-specific demethylase [Chlorella desiccata (nom. nud.)]